MNWPKKEFGLLDYWIIAGLLDQAQWIIFKKNSVVFFLFLLFFKY